MEAKEWGPALPAPVGNRKNNIPLPPFLCQESGQTGNDCNFSCVEAREWRQRNGDLPCLLLSATEKTTFLCLHSFAKSRGRPEMTAISPALRQENGGKGMGTCVACSCRQPKKQHSFASIPL